MRVSTLGHVLLLGLAALVGASDWAAAQTVEPARAALPDTVRSSGVLRVATSLQWPPFANVAEAGGPDGIDIRLMKLLAEKLGLRAEIEDVKFPSIVPGVASGRFDAGVDQINPVAALKVLSDRLGHDLSAFPLDQSVPELPPSGMMQGHAIQLASIARRRRMTLRELRDYAAVSSGHRVSYGTAEMIADDLETWFRSGAADGFIIQVTHHPGPLDDFVDQVIPLLVERGLFRRDYEGRTLRDHLGLIRPGG